MLCREEGASRAEGGRELCRAEGGRGDGAM